MIGCGAPPRHCDDIRKLGLDGGEQYYIHPTGVETDAPIPVSRPCVRALFVFTLL